LPGNAKRCVIFPEDVIAVDRFAVHVREPQRSVAPPRSFAEDQALGKRGRTGAWLEQPHDLSVRLTERSCERLEPGASPAAFAEGLVFGEGPRWRDGSLWLSDMHGEAVYSITSSGKMTQRLALPGKKPSGLGFPS